MYLTDFQLNRVCFPLGLAIAVHGSEIPSDFKRGLFQSVLDQFSKSVCVLLYYILITYFNTFQPQSC